MPIRRVPRPQFRGFLEEAFRRDNPPGSIAVAARGLEAFGLLPPGFELEEVLVATLEEGIAGVYDPTSKTLLLPEDLSGGPGGETTLVHEIAHAIDDAAYDLSRFRSGRLDDAAAAAGALIEGSATATMVDHLLASRSGLFRDAVGHPLAGLGIAGFSASSERITRLLPAAAASGAAGRVPPAVRVALLFPYARGLAFVHALRARHGRAALERAFLDPPRSSEQVLHPERFAGRREDPVEIALATTAPEAGREVSAGRMGEFGIYLVLAERVEGAAARRAAAGWGGDAYRVLEGEEGRLGLLWHTEWDRARDAGHFAAVLAEAWGKRYGRTPTIDGPARVVFRADGRVLRIESSGRRVLLADGFSAAEAKRLLGAMAEKDRVRRPGEKPGPSTLSGGAGLLRPLFDRERFDRSTRTTLLRGLLASHEAREGGFEVSLAAGLLARVASDSDRTSVSTLLGLVDFEANARAGMASAYLGPLLHLGKGPRAQGISLAFGLLGEASGPGGSVVRTGLLDFEERRTLAYEGGGEEPVATKVERRLSLLFGLLSFSLP